MSLITQSTADYQARQEAARLRSAAARKAAETRRNNKREQREFEQSQENKLAWTYENTLTIEQRQELESSLHEMALRFDAKAEKFAKEQEAFVTVTLKDAAVKYGWNQVKAATTLSSYDVPRYVWAHSQRVELGDVLDDLHLMDEAFAEVDDYFDRDVPELLSKDRTPTFPEESEADELGGGEIANN